MERLFVLNSRLNVLYTKYQNFHYLSTYKKPIRETLTKYDYKNVKERNDGQFDIHYLLS